MLSSARLSANRTIEVFRINVFDSNDRLLGKPPTKLRFPQVCVVIQIYNRPNPCYHFPFLYDDEDDTIGRQAHSTAIRGPHPNPAQIPNRDTAIRNRRKRAQNQQDAKS